MFAFFKKYIIAILAIALLLGSVVTKLFQTAKTSSQETLVVGLQSGYPPFEFMDAKGKISRL